MKRCNDIVRKIKSKKIDAKKAIFFIFSAILLSVAVDLLISWFSFAAVATVVECSPTCTSRREIYVIIPASIFWWMLACFAGLFFFSCIVAIAIDRDDKKKEKIYYLSHPYTAPTTEGEKENFDDATRVASELIDLGFSIYSPITYTHPMRATKERDWDAWMKLDEVFAGQCDAVILCPGWENSRGCTHEKKLFEKAGKDVYILEDFLQCGDSEK